jgi:hypothetical protein
MVGHKVFGIGFHKTGTSTLGVALRKLGYKVCGDRLELVDTLIQDDLSSALKLVEEYDAFQDNPWPLLYKELDFRYPNSKFILTLRDERKWIKSVVNHFGKKHTMMREWLYGIGFPEGNEHIYLDRYRKHNQEVLEYFQDRSDNLLVVSWEQGDGWKELCSFLGKPLPDMPFPHVNKGKYTTKFERMVNSIRQNLKTIYNR